MVYLYCLFLGKGSTNPEFNGLKGIDSSFPELKILFHEDIGAVVSIVGTDFEPEKLERNIYNNLEWLANSAINHNQIVDRTAETHTTLPCKFCTIFTEEDKVRELLRNEYTQLSDKLVKLKDMHEWGLKVICFRDALLGMVEEQNPKAKEINQQMTGISKGKDFFLKKRLEQIVAEASERLKAEFTQHIHKELVAVVEDSVENKIFDESVFTGEKKEVALSNSYLVKENMQEEFLVKVRELQAGNLAAAFEIIFFGPLPPYHFS